MELFFSQASVAVSYLNRIHALKKRGAIPCSLYLDQILKQSGSYKDKPVSFNIQKEKMLDVHVRKVWIIHLTLTYDISFFAEDLWGEIIHNYDRSLLTTLSPLYICKIIP